MAVASLVLTTRHHATQLHICTNSCREFSCDHNVFRFQQFFFYSLFSKAIAFESIACVHHAIHASVFMPFSQRILRKKSFLLKSCTLFRVDFFVLFASYSNVIFIGISNKNTEWTSTPFWTNKKNKKQFFFHRWKKHVLSDILKSFNRYNFYIKKKCQIFCSTVHQNYFSFIFFELLSRRLLLLLFCLAFSHCYYVLPHRRTKKKSEEVKPQTTQSTWKWGFVWVFLRNLYDFLLTCCRFFSFLFLFYSPIWSCCRRIVSVPLANSHSKN